MASQVVRAALGELDRQLELARDVLRQLEAEIGHTGYQGGGWENPSEALPYLLDQLQESLLVLLEIAELLPVAGSPPGSSRRAAGYSPVLRLTADEVSLPLFPCPQKFTFWDTTLLPRGTFWVRSAPGPLADAPRPVFLLLACCTQEEDALATSMEGRAGVCTCHSKLR